MADSTPLVDAAVVEQWKGLFAQPGFATEVGLWLERADRADRRRFERVFAALGMQVQETLRSKAGGAEPRTATGRASTTAAVATRLPPVSAPQRPPNSGFSYIATTKLASEKAAQKQRPASSLVASEQEAAAARAAAEQAGLRALSAPDDKADARRRNDGARQRNPFVSVYHSTYNARDEYPELYENISSYVTSGPVAASNRPVCELDNSMRASKDDPTRPWMMKSTYTVANEQVVKDDTDFDVNTEKAFFEKWMLRQKTYYGELLQQVPQEVLEEVFSNASTEQKREILQTLRQVYAITNPDSLSLRSQSQSAHCAMVNPEDPALTALNKALTKLKTFGGDTTSLIAQQRGEAAEAAAAAAAAGKEAGKEAAAVGEAAAAAGAAPGSPASRARPTSTSIAQMLDLTFSHAASSPKAGASKEPAGSGTSPSLPWLGAGPALNAAAVESPTGRGGAAAAAAAATAAGPGPSALDRLPESMRPLTSLAQKQAQKLNGHMPLTGGTLGRSQRARKPAGKNKMLASSLSLDWPGHIPQNTTYKDAYGAAVHPPHERATYINDNSCIVGIMNPRTAKAPLRTSYPLPECFVAKPPFPQPLDSATNNRSNYCARSSEDMLRSHKDARRDIELSRQAGQRTTLPIGKDGIDLAPRTADWRSQQHDVHSGRSAPADLRGAHEMADAIRVMLAGPTASAGALVPAVKA